MKVRAQHGGRFDFEVYNPDGSLDRRFSFENGWTTVGANYLLDAGFDGGTQASTWYIGLINDSGFSSVSTGDTAGSHAGWTESTAYAEATRPEWTNGSASGGSMTNSSTVNFTMNATVSIKGAFLISNSTKGGSTGTLFATGTEDTAQSLTSGQVLKVTYTPTITPS